MKHERTEGQQPPAHFDVILPVVTRGHSWSLVSTVILDPIGKQHVDVFSCNKLVLQITNGFVYSTLPLNWPACRLLTIGPYRKKLDRSRASDWPIKFEDLGFRPAQMLEKK